MGEKVDASCARQHCICPHKATATRHICREWRSAHRGLLQEELVLGDGVGGEESPQHTDGGLEQVDHALAIVETKGCLQSRRWARGANGEHGHGVSF